MNFIRTTKNDLGDVTIRGTFQTAVPSDDQEIKEPYSAADFK